MKVAVLSLLLIVALHTTAQTGKLLGTWISAEQDCIKIENTTDTVSTYNKLCNGDRDENMTLQVWGDTLSFQKRYYSSATDYKTLSIDRYDMLLTRQSDTILIVRPCSSLSQMFYNQRKELKFIKQEYNRDTTINFDKIIYHTTRCFGDCPEIDMEIDHQGNIHMNGAFKIGSSSKETIGQFTAKLTDSLYNELTALLQTSSLRTLYFPEHMGDDAPVETLILYYNGQRKFLTSMFPPVIAMPLLSFLFTLKDRIALTQTNEKWNIEGDGSPPPPPEPPRHYRK